jgi:signal transduction histidine kinase
MVGSKIKDALVFVRFGGPDYLDTQINLAKLIAEHVEQLLERQNLVKKIVSLEAERQLDLLQQEFVATISHDLRTPLGFIKGYATTLLRDDTEWDVKTSREFLTIIDEEVDRLSELIENLLDSSRLQTGTLRMEFQNVYIEPLLQDLVHRIHSSDYKIRVQLDIDPDCKAVRADPIRLIQVFDNLLNNAEKYAPNSVVQISVKCDASATHFIIQDNGKGIPEAHLEDIFRRFYRVKDDEDVAQGSGLGLFICRKIVQAHNGKIFAETVPDAGATFHIYLPKSENNADVVNQMEKNNYEY